MRKERLARELCGGVRGRTALVVAELSRHIGTYVVLFKKKRSRHTYLANCFTCNLHLHVDSDSVLSKNLAGRC